jgi:uncharacterized protein (TIGR02265 family)
MPAQVPSERLIFGSSVEALLKAGVGRLSSASTAKLRQLGMGAERKLAPAYPAEDWAEAVRLIGSELFPTDAPEVQHNKLARLTVKQFSETVMGKAIFAAARVFGARRSMARLAHNLRTGANFIETRFASIDAVTDELWISDVSGVPGFYSGLVEAGSDYLEGWAYQMRIKSYEGAGCLYELKSPSRRSG